MPDTPHPPSRTVAVLLNVAHALDHLFLLIFATAVAAIATDFGFSRWEDLMPYGVGAFLMFGSLLFTCYNCRNNCNRIP